MATQAPAKLISPEEYLAQEQQAKERHEYIQGNNKFTALSYLHTHNYIYTHILYSRL